jgi:hypothetical protein
VVAACFDHVAAARQFTHDTERARAGLAEAEALLARAEMLTRRPRPANRARATRSSSPS